MQTKWKATIVTLLVAVPAFMFGAGAPAGNAMWNAVWPFAMAAEAEPAGGQVAFLMLYGAIAAIAFGLAVAFLAFGLPLLRRVTGGDRRMAVGMGLAGAWVLGNWWIHDSLHIVNGVNYWGLIILEFAFHVTLIAAGAYLLWSILNLARGGAFATAPMEGREAMAATA